MKKTVFTFLAAAFMAAMPAAAQDKPEANISADLVSQYIWRGMELGRASVLPELELGWKGLSLTIEGAIGTTSEDAVREVDITLGYTLGNLSFGATDYWDGTADESYLFRSHHRTNHVIEGFLSYDFGPFSASWQTMFAGADGENTKGKRAYSSYVELRCPFKFATCDWEAEVGVVPYATTYYNTTGFGLTNVTLKVTKSIDITDRFSLPLFIQVASNPYHRNAYVAFGVTLTTAK